MIIRAHPSPHAKRYLDYFSRFCRIHPRYVKTDRHTHTDHVTTCVAMGRIYAMHTMRPNDNNATVGDSTWMQKVPNRSSRVCEVFWCRVPVPYTCSAEENHSSVMRSQLPSAHAVVGQVTLALTGSNILYTIIANVNMIRWVVGRAASLFDDCVTCVQHQLPLQLRQLPRQRQLRRRPLLLLRHHHQHHPVPVQRLSCLNL